VVLVEAWKLEEGTLKNLVPFSISLLRQIYLREDHTILVTR
jgi:hypothetical protein